jgi:hypothetical protein
MQSRTFARKIKGLRAFRPCAISEDYGPKDALMSGMKWLTLLVFTMELLRSQAQPTLPAAIHNPFRFGTPGPVVAAGFDGAGNLYLAGRGRTQAYIHRPRRFSVQLQTST